MWGSFCKNLIEIVIRFIASSASFLLFVATSPPKTRPLFFFMRTLLDAVVVKSVMTVNHQNGYVFATILADRKI